MEAVTRWLKVLTKRVDVLEKDSADGLDNDQVNAAIADDPAATRAVLGVEPLVPHIVSFRRNTVLALTDGGWTQVPLNDAFLNPAGMANLATGKIEVKRAGWYSVTVAGALKNPVGPIGRVVFNAVGSRFNGTYLGNVAWAEQGGLSGYTTVTLSVPFYLNEGDLVALQIFQNGGGGIQIEEDADYQRPFISLIEISPKERPEISPLLTRKVVGFGDSQTEGNIIIESGGADLVWGEWLSSSFVNHGHSGVSAVGFATTYASEITGSADINADCVVELGTNDIGYNVGVDVSEVADGIEEILDLARPLYRSITWVVPGPSIYSGYANSANYEVDRQALIAEMVSRDIEGLNIARTDLDVDIGQAADALNRIWYLDGLHWSPLAQQRVSQIVESVLP